MKNRIIKLDKFADSRGWSVNDIYSIVRENLMTPQARTPYDKSYDFKDCQINYSIMYPGVVKAWHRHKHQDDYFFVLHGMAQVGVYSEDWGAQKFFIGEHNPSVVHIKAGEWHGLTAVGDKPVGLLYLVTNTYNPTFPDEERAAFDKFVGADWWKPENK